MNPTTPAEPIQPLLWAPLELLQCGLARAHVAPLVAERTPDGLRAWREPAGPHVWKHPLLEWSRTPIDVCAIVLDCDSREAVERVSACAVDAGVVPSPSLISTRIASGHCHAAWMLAKPVHRGEAARPKPYKMLARAAEYFTQVLGADPGYNHVLTANPVHGDYETAWLRVGRAFQLRELTAAIPRGWRRPAKAITAWGRNCLVFEYGMRVDGSPAVDDLEVEAAIRTYADETRTEAASWPLDPHEVDGIVRSVLRYRRQWRRRETWHQGTFIERQRTRGRRSAEKRRATAATVLKPWEAAGVSRATWYRDRKRTEPKRAYRKVRQEPTQMLAP